MTIINKEDFKIKKELNRPILSLDYGESKVGIAISDPNCTIALPSEVYKRNKTDKDFIYIKEFIEKNDIQAVLIGMPYNMDGTEGEKCIEVKNFTNKLLEFININIIFWDERFSTQAQEKILIEQDLSRKKRKKVIDKLAAGYFLQSFLDFLKN
tara:strand:- start:797 stop:1258 length:462 start_codon:yes stop_codon:yes gene_type:complete